MRALRADERGVTALVVAAGMLLFLGITALAVDIGLAYSERRADQTSVDSGVMAGALQAFEGSEGIRDSALQYVRVNLPISYGNPANPLDATWLGIWDGCTDPARPPGFMPVPAYPTMASATIDCISVNAQEQQIRVNLPEQLVETHFAPVIGVDELKVDAEAMAKLTPMSGPGGVLPFGVLSSSSPGSEVCLRSSATGTAVPPCTGASSGNFHAVNSPLFGEDDHGTSQVCSGARNDRLAVNIRLGLDHFVDPLGNESPPLNWMDSTNWVVDQCNPIDIDINRLNTFTGLGNALTEGLAQPRFFAAAPSSTPRLQQGSNPKVAVRSGTSTWNLDDWPLWRYIDGSNGIPGCQISDFIGKTFEERNDHMRDVCLPNAAAAGTRLFRSSIVNSPRFGLAPLLWETSWPAGSSVDRTMRDRVPVFIHGLYFNCSAGACGLEYEPGEDPGPLCDPSGGPGGCATLTLDQVTGFYLPVTSVDLSDFQEGPGGNLGPFTIELIG